MAEDTDTDPVTDTGGGGAAPPGGAPPPASGAASGEGEPSPGVPPPNNDFDWRKARIDKLTAQLKQAREENLSLRAQVPPMGAQGDPQAIEAEVNRRANAAIEPEISRRIAEREFNSRCETVARSGEKEYGAREFQEKVNSILSVVDRSSPDAMAGYREFLAACMETGQAEKILYELGGNLNEAHRVLSLSPARMGVALAKMTEAREDSVSSAPKPIRPVTPRAVPQKIDPDDPNSSDKLDISEWMARRADQAKARGIR